jgi:aryl-alcohol dehydrogenase-like predicted oxidoreductase
VAIIAYAPIGREMLSVTIRSYGDLESSDFRRLIPRFSEENFPKDLELVDEINALAKEKGCTASQLTRAWLLARRGDVFPIPGTT